jgi:hypothetical protein
MRIRTRLDKLQKEAGELYDTLQLPDGTSVRYTGDDALSALVALMEGEEHWFLNHLQVASLDSRQVLPRLVGALEGRVDEPKG